MTSFNASSPEQVTECLKSLMDEIYQDAKSEFDFNKEKLASEDLKYDLSMSVLQLSRLPKLANLITLDPEIRKAILLAIFENDYFLKNYHYEIIAAVINNISKNSTPIDTKTFLDHFNTKWQYEYPDTGKSKAVCHFQSDCRFWLLFLRLLTKSVERAPELWINDLARKVMDCVLKFKAKFKGYGHYPELSTLIISLLNLGDKNIVSDLKNYCIENIPKVNKQIELILDYSNGDVQMLCQFLKASENQTSSELGKDLLALNKNKSSAEFRKLCNDLLNSYLPSEEEIKKLAQLSGGTLDMDVILSMQRQLYQEYQDITQYEELGRNITKRAIMSLGLLEPEIAIDDIDTLLMKYYQFNDFCKTAIYTLENIKSERALKTLSKLQTLVTDKSIKQIINSALIKVNVG